MNRCVLSFLFALYLSLGSVFAMAQVAPRSPTTTQNEEVLDGVNLPSNTDLGGIVNDSMRGDLFDFMITDDSDAEIPIRPEELRCGEFATCLSPNPQQDGFTGAAINEADVNDILDDYRDLDLTTNIETGLNGVIDSCVPILEVEQSQESQEYRCNSGQAISENFEFCRRPLEYEIVGDVDYRCFISVDSNGVETLSPECETLEASGLCERVGQGCTQFSGPVFENRVCRIGPEDAQIDRNCVRERVHQLAVFAQYDCEFVRNEVTGELQPVAGCESIIGNPSCSEGEAECDQFSEPEFETALCRIGTSLDYENIDCNVTVNAVADEDFIWTVTRRFDESSVDEAIFIRTEEYLNAQREDCTFGEEECSELEPERARQDVCRRGLIFSDVTNSCEVPLEVTVDEDYVYEGGRDFNRVQDIFVNEQDRDVLGSNAQCRLISSECREEFVPDFDTFSCLRGYTEEFAAASCEAVLVPVIDHRFRYVGSETKNANDLGFTRDPVLLSATSNSLCLLEGRECVQEAVPLQNTFSYEQGFAVEEGEFTVRRERLITVDTDYNYLGYTDYNSSTRSQVDDILVEHVSALGSSSGCQVTGSECVTPSGGVTDTYSCVAGYRQSFETDSCAVNTFVSGGSSYIYQGARDFDFIQGRFVGEVSWNRLNANSVCGVSNSRCVELTAERFEARVCRQGQSTQYDDTRIVEDLEVVVDTDYIFAASRVYQDNTDRYVNSARLNTLGANNSCSVIGESCVRTGPTTINYSCESGNDRSVDRQVCIHQREVTVDADFVYSVSRQYDYDNDRFAPNTDFDGIRSQAGCVISSGPSCTQGAVAQFEDNVCRQGYIQNTADRSCTYGQTFDVLTDYFYDVRSNYSSGSYVREVFGNTAASSGCTVVPGTRRDAFGTREYSTYACSRGSFNSGTNATCIINGSTTGSEIHSYDVVFFDIGSSTIEAVVSFMEVVNGCVTSTPRGSGVEYAWQCSNYVDPKQIEAFAPPAGGFGGFGGFGSPVITPGSTFESILVDYEVRSDFVDEATACSTQRAGRTKVSETCTSSDGVFCTRSEIVYRGQNSITYNTCSVPSGYSSVSGSNISYRRAVDNSKDIERTSFCDTGHYFNPSNGARVNQSCNLPSGAVVLSNTCLARTGSTCTLTRRQYRYSDPGPDRAYLTHFTEEYQCPVSVAGRTANRTDRYASAPKAVSVPSSCLNSPTSPPAGCVVKTNTARPRALTIGGISSNNPSGSWGRNVVFTCETTRTATNTCPQLALNDNISQPLVMDAALEIKPAITSNELHSFGYPRALLQLTEPELDPLQSEILLAQAGSREVIGERCLAFHRGVCTLSEFTYREEQPDTSGGCSEQTEEWRCENTSTFGSLVRTIREVTRDVYNESACNALKGRNECVLISNTPDSSTGESRVINGLSVTRSAWARNSVYDCTELTAVNTCTVPSGSALVSQTCLDQDEATCHKSRFNYAAPRDGLVDNCEEFETEFRCEDRILSGVRREAKEIMSERYVPRSAAPSGSSCQLVSRVNGVSESRFIDGLQVTRPFTRSSNYTCSEATAIDDCNGDRTDGLNEQRRCIRNNRQGQCELFEYSFDLLLDDPSNGCSRFIDDFACSSSVDGVGAALAVPDSLPADVKENGACVSLAANDTCRVLSEACVVPGGTRIINGQSVTRDCWRYAREYECESRAVTDNCNVESRFELVEETCLSRDRSGACTLSEFDYEAEGHDPSGGCFRREHSFRCENTLAGFTPVSEFKHILTNVIEAGPVIALRAEHFACQYVRSHCVDGVDETRNIDGLDVTQSCWTLDVDYTCQDRIPFAGCNAPDNFIESGRACISEFNGTCTGERIDGTFETFDNEGECLRFEESHICQVELAGFDYADRLSRFSSARFDTSDCQSIEQRGDECVRQATLCLEGPETRLIEGVEVFQECWRQQYDYECSTVENINECELPIGAELLDDTFCEFTHRNGDCTLSRLDYRFPVPNSSGGCQRFVETFRCDNEISQFTAVDTILSVDNITEDISACEGVLDELGIDCEDVSVCIEGPETRLVDGLEVYQDCWKRRIDQVCAISTEVDTCRVPDDATLSNDTCVDSDDDGNCVLNELTYDYFERDASGGCHLFEVPVTCDARDVILRAPERSIINIFDTQEDRSSCEPVFATFDECVSTGFVCDDETPDTRAPESFVTRSGERFVPLNTTMIPDVTRDCWGGTRTYECVTRTIVDECGPYDNSGACSRSPQSECLQSDKDGSCVLFEADYQCEIEGSVVCTREGRVFECEVEQGGATILGLNDPLQSISPFSQPFDDVSIFSVAANNNEPSFGIGDVALPGLDQGQTPEPIGYRVEVIGSGFDNESCDLIEAGNQCTLVSDECAEPVSGLHDVRRSQSDFYDQFLSFAPQVQETCFNRERVYDCGAASQEAVCEGQENSCNLLEENCLLTSDDGTCLISDNTYDCQTAACEASQFICDERLGDNGYVGHRYTCFSISQIGAREITPDGLFEDYCQPVRTGCSSHVTSIETFTTSGFLRGEPSDLISTTTNYEIYCPTERVVGANITYHGYVDGSDIQADSSSCGVYEGNEDCVELSSECFGVLSGAFCNGAERKSYSCLPTGEGEACSGQCSSSEATYSCTEEVPGAGDPVNIDEPQLIGGYNEDECQRIEESSACEIANEVCIEGPETRLIDGVSVFAECWEFEREYYCQRSEGFETDCDPAPECELVETNCLGEATDGNCVTSESVYRCTSEEAREECAPAEAPSDQREASDSSDGAPGRDFFDIISAVNGVGQGTNEGASEPDIFGGELLECGRLILGAKNCCSRSGILIALGCNSQEQALQVQREEDLCISNGSYCDRRAFFGACLQSKQAYCCYDSRLVRTIVEAGNIQLNRDFGRARDTNCRGFSVEEFQSLDLSEVDFSGVAQDIVDNANLDPNDGVAQRLSDSINRLQGNNGGPSGTGEGDPSSTTVNNPPQGDGG